MAVVWWHVFATSELFFVLPGLTWKLYRKTWEQKICDVARTLPLIIYVTLAASGSVEGLGRAAPIAGIVGFTVVANLAQYEIDSKMEKSNPLNYKFTRGAEFAYIAALTSPLSFVTGTPGFFSGAPRSPVRILVAAVNLAAALYLTASIITTKALADAWDCYPHPRKPEDLRWGYCPQKLHNYYTNEACIHLGDSADKRLCDPDEQTKNIHARSPLGTHITAILLLISFAGYLVQLPECLLEARLGAEQRKIYLLGKKE